jgi:hypothetical protein
VATVPTSRKTGYHGHVHFSMKLIPCDDIKFNSTPLLGPPKLGQWPHLHEWVGRMVLLRASGLAQFY